MAHIPEDCETITSEQWTKLAEEFEQDAKETRKELEDLQQPTNGYCTLKREGLEGYAEALEMWAFRFRERSVLARLKAKGKI